MHDLIDNRHCRSELRRLFAWSSALMLEPGELANEHIKTFAKAVEQSGFDRPRQLIGDAVRSWGKCRVAIAEWPQTELQAPDTGVRQSLGFAELPLAFQRDVEAFLAATSGDDLFDDRHMKPLRPATRRDRMNKFCQLATRFVETGRDLSLLQSLADLVELSAVKDIFSKIWDDIGQQPNGHAHNLARLVALVAKRWVNLPAGHLQIIKNAEGRLRPTRKGMTDRNQEKLRVFMSDDEVRKIVNLPTRVLRSLDRANPTVSDAVIAQLAVAVGLLLVAPVRMENLSSIDIAQHFQRVDKKTCFLIFPAHEVKNDQDLEFPIPSSILEILDVYLKIYRPLLMKLDSSKLFVSWNGKPKTPAQLSAQISKFVRHHSGLELHAHGFRHLAGLIFLKAYPGEVESVRRILGHQSVITTANHYIGLEKQEAFKRYDEILDQMIERAKEAANAES